MKNILKQMQSSAIRYTAVISEILKVAVTIVDNNQVRIASTGHTTLDVGKNMSERGHIVKAALETGELQVMKEPKSHPACQECRYYDSCRELLEIWAPIKVRKNVVGAIGFVCETAAQKRHIVKGFESDLAFLQQMAELIGLEAAALEEREKDIAAIRLLELVFARLDMGIISAGEDDQVLQMNHFAQKLLNVEEMGGRRMKMVLERTGNVIANTPEYRMLLNENSYLLVGNVFEIDIKPYTKVFMFHDAKNVRENGAGLVELGRRRALDQIIGNSDQTFQIKERIRMISGSVSSVLITGEEGVDKELYARVIHQESDRVNQPMITVNCSAIPEGDLEKELFGMARNSQNGNSKGKVGKLELASSGVLFLNEVGSLSLTLQGKLARVLDRQEFCRIGSKKMIKLNTRIIAASNENLEDRIARGEFRQDLYYLLSVIPLNIPPLRERKEDIRLLALYYIDRYSRQLKRSVSGIDETFFQCLESYDWPGNVRELQNVMEFVVNMLGYPGLIKAEHLPSKIFKSSNLELPQDINLKNMEREIIRKALLIYGNGKESKREIAQRLGIGTATLYRKISEYHLN